MYFTGNVERYVAIIRDYGCCIIRSYFTFRSRLARNESIISSSCCSCNTSRGNRVRFRVGTCGRPQYAQSNCFISQLYNGLSYNVTFDPQASLKLNEAKDHTRETVEFEMRAQPGAFFATQTLNIFMYQLQAGSEVTRARVLRALHSFENSTRYD
jgi:hypothetical protein